MHLAQPCIYLWTAKIDHETRASAERIVIVAFRGIDHDESVKQTKSPASWRHLKKHEAPQC